MAWFVCVPVQILQTINPMFVKRPASFSDCQLVCALSLLSAANLTFGLTCFLDVLHYK